MLLSICIPTYRRVRFLGDLLSSIAREMVPDVEVVITDNASGDGTRELANRAKNVFKNFNYYEWPVNEGPDKNFLKAVEIASGKFCWFVGSDDQLEPDCLAALVKKLLLPQADGGIFILNKQEYDVNLKYKIESRQLRQESTTAERAAFLGYIGALCFDRRTWMANVSTTSQYIGTAYVHVAILAKAIKNGASVFVLSDKYIMWRSNNDSILVEVRALGRAKIEINYLNIMMDVFGPDSAEAIYAKRYIIGGNFVGLLRGYKLNGVERSVMAKCYRLASPLATFRERCVLLGYVYAPVVLVQLAKSMYRICKRLRSLVYDKGV